MLNAELKSMNSILTYESFLSRCVRAGWRAVVMASSVEWLDLQCPPLILTPLVNMSKGGCENKSSSLIFFIFHSNNSQFFLPFIEVQQLKMGRKSYGEINVFLQYMLATIIGTPRNSYE